MKTKKNVRGFAYKEFIDRYGVECSIQKSSLATEDAIWFGANKIGLKEFVPNSGWKDLTMFDGNTIRKDGIAYTANNRMHLTRKQVKKLLPILQKFVDTGEL